MAEDEMGRRAVENAVQRCYSTWGTSYHGDYYGPNAPYPPVHVDLLRRLVLESGARTVLDAGCGPASFLRYLANDQKELYGFDLTPEMVAEGKRVMEGVGVDGSRIWQGSVLDSEAYSMPGSGAPAIGYDSSVCVGVLPHIQEGDEAKLFANLHSAVRSDGTVIVEARNQLFSLFTLNRPSYEFFRDELIRADDLLLKHRAEHDALLEALTQLESHFRMDLPPIRRGKAGEPGYDEVVSRTHNPLTLRASFEAAGFERVRVLFYHFHVVPPMLAGSLGERFVQESIAMERPDDWRGYFMASAFLLLGIRK